MSDDSFSSCASRISLFASIEAHSLINRCLLCEMKDKGEMVEQRPGHMPALPWQWEQWCGWEFSPILQENQAPWLSSLACVLARSRQQLPSATHVWHRGRGFRIYRGPGKVCEYGKWNGQKKGEGDAQLSLDIRESTPQSFSRWLLKRKPCFTDLLLTQSSLVLSQTSHRSRLSGSLLQDPRAPWRSAAKLYEGFQHRLRRMVQFLF